MAISVRGFSQLLFVLGTGAECVSNLISVGLDISPLLDVTDAVSGLIDLSRSGRIACTCGSLATRLILHEFCLARVCMVDGLKTEISISITLVHVIFLPFYTTSLYKKLVSKGASDFDSRSTYIVSWNFLIEKSVLWKIREKHCQWRYANTLEKDITVLQNNIRLGETFRMIQCSLTTILLSSKPFGRLEAIMLATPVCMHDDPSYLSFACDTLYR